MYHRLTGKNTFFWFLVSGWEEEVSNCDNFSPTILISLMAPKKCAASFSGTHYLVGRLLPYDIQRKYDLNPQDYSGTDCLVELEYDQPIKA